MATETAKTTTVRVGPVLVLADEIAKQSAEVQEAITAGDLVAEIADVEIGSKAAQNPTGKDLVGSYLRLLATSIKGMSVKCNHLVRPAVKPKDEKGNTIPTDKWTPEQVEAAKKGVCDHFNYGSDLDDNRACRTEMLRDDAVEGPGKAVKAAFAGAVAMGYSKTEAAEMLRNSPKFKGVDGIEELITRAVAA